MKLEELKDGFVEYSALPARLGFSRHQLDKYAKGVEGFPPRIRFGRRLFVKERAVIEWFRSRIAQEDEAA